MPLFVHYCYECGAALRHDGTAGPSAAELAARLAAAEKRGREYENAYTVKTHVCDDLMLQINHLTGRIRELDRKLAAAEADTRRLDALETANLLRRKTHLGLKDPNTFGEVGHHWECLANTGPGHSADTLRALADALEVDA